MSEEIMDKNWRKQLKSKAGFMVMFILGSVFGFFLIWGQIFCIIEDAPYGWLACFFAFAGCVFCIIRGLIGIASVRRHNRRIESLYEEEFAAKKTAQELKAVLQQNSAADELKKYQQLMQEGIITQEEFETKKKQLLDL